MTFITFAETASKADKITTTPFAGRDEQLAMLTAFLNLAQAGLAAGMPVPAQVTVTYRKVTAAKARIDGADYQGMPGLATVTHTGRVVKVARNRKGEVYFTLDDANRTLDGDRGFTALRLEGLMSFAFTDPRVQAQARAGARALLAAQAGRVA